MKEQNETAARAGINRSTGEVIKNDQLENISAGVSGEKSYRAVKAPGRCFHCQKEGVHSCLYKFKGVYVCLEKGHIYRELSEDSYIETNYRMAIEAKKYV